MEDGREIEIDSLTGYEKVKWKEEELKKFLSSVTYEQLTSELHRAKKACYEVNRIYETSVSLPPLKAPIGIEGKYLALIEDRKVHIGHVERVVKTPRDPFNSHEIKLKDESLIVITDNSFWGFQGIIRYDIEEESPSRFLYADLWRFSKEKESNKKFAVIKDNKLVKELLQLKHELDTLK